MLRSRGFDKIDADLDYLMSCFREMVESLGGLELAETLPWSPKRRKTQNGLAKNLNGVCQAYSISFQLLNMVEENVAAQTRRAREAELGLEAEPGLWGHQLRRLARAGVAPEKIASMLSEVVVEPVLTAHPTEAKRATVLEQHRSLYLLLVKKENQMWSPSEMAGIREEFKIGLEQLWRTGEILVQKPDVAAERRSTFHYLREVFPRVVPLLDQRLRRAWEDAGLDLALVAKPDNMPRIRFGTWVGGDRDGHPLVTADVTRDTLAELRAAAVSVIHQQLSTLATHLTLSSHFQKPPPPLLARIVGLEGEVADAGRISKMHSEEPWRHFVALLQAKLPPAAGADAATRPHFTRPEELHRELDFLSHTLHTVGAWRIARAHVWPIMRLLSIFGFHLASLDIRQNSMFHEKALAQILAAAGVADDYGSWDEARRLEFLDRELRSPRPFLHPDTRCGPEAEAVLDCYRVLAGHLRSHGPDGLGSLIVSMTRTLSDLLSVYLFARETGVASWRDGTLVCDLPVVPLFETVEDLQKGPSVMRDFLAHPATAASLDHRATGNLRARVQQVMVGYSDSNKESGIFSSQWSLHRAQHEIAEAGRACGADIQFFHGRGGTISRGAGPTHRFLEALPGGSLRGKIRVTEQGETIAQKYANQITATYNLELLVSGVTSASLLGARLMPAALDRVCERVAAESRDAFRELLDTPGFFDFYTEATPIDALEASSIGSRPSRRRAQATISELRAIPWVFSWTQSRYFLPGWYGVGAALESLQTNDPEGFETFRAAAGSDPFLRFVLTNVETNLASADLQLMQEYSHLVRDTATRRKVFSTIAAEYERTDGVLHRIFGQRLTERRPRMFKTLKLRADALADLHRYQIGLLARWRDLRRDGETAAAASLLPSVLLSVNAIASGLRTTG